MAFGGNFGSGFEYPHSSFYDSDLSEMLRKYRQLVDEYNEILEKVREAQKNWRESIDYVDKWNRKWEHDMAKFRQDLVKTSEEIREVQTELIKRFEAERTSMASYMDNVLWQIKEDNNDTREEIDELISNYVKQVENLHNLYVITIKDNLEKFQQAFETSLNLLSLDVKNNLKGFENFVGVEMETLMSVFESYDKSVNNFWKMTMQKYDDLLATFEGKLNLKALELMNNYHQELEEVQENIEAVDRKYSSAVERLEKLIQDVKDYRIEVQTDDIIIISPVTHRLKRIQWVVDEMWRAFLAWAIEAEEFDALGLTAGEIDNWQCNWGLLPGVKGIEALDFDALGKWILLEKPDILARLQSQIEQITYDKLAENTDKIIKEVTDASITNTASHFSGIIHTVTVIEGKLEPIEGYIKNLKSTATVIEGRIDNIVNTTSIAISTINSNIETLTELQQDMDNNLGEVQATLGDAVITINSNGNYQLTKGV